METPAFCFGKLKKTAKGLGGADPELQLDVKYSVVNHYTPADDNAVVKQVNFDVLDADGLVEALGDQEPQQAPQVRGVVQRDPHLRGEALQQRQQHGPGVNLP